VKALVLTKTAGFHHESIDAGVTMLQQHEADWNLDLTITDNTSLFTPEALKPYRLLVLLNTTGDLFDSLEQQAFKDWVEGGGAVLAVHAAADAEYNWPWYRQMLGGWFSSHPDIQEATCIKILPAHFSVAELPDQWTRSDEWYNFGGLFPGNTVLYTVDEQTYTGGTHGGHHPIIWTRDVGDGRVFYTGMGHTPETFAEPLFIKHIAGAVNWLTGP
jgi:type 1 glutamine amidotransferase